MNHWWQLFTQTACTEITASVENYMEVLVMGWGGCCMTVHFVMNIDHYQSGLPGCCGVIMLVYLAVAVVSSWDTIAIIKLLLPTIMPRSNLLNFVCCNLILVKLFAGMMLTGIDDWFHSLMSTTLFIYFLKDVIYSYIPRQLFKE